MTVLELAKQILREEAEAEAVEWGIAEGMEKGAEKMLLNGMKPSMVSNILDMPLKRVETIHENLVLCLLQEKHSASEIAETLELTLKQVQEIQKKASKKAETPSHN